MLSEWLKARVVLLLRLTLGLASEEPAPPAPICRVPPVTLVGPVYELAPARINVPAPLRPSDLPAPPSPTAPETVRLAPEAALTPTLSKNETGTAIVWLPPLTLKGTVLPPLARISVLAVSPPLRLRV